MNINQTKDIRTANRIKIIDAIIKNKEISRVEISKAANLNKATISTIVKEWIDLNIITETELGSSSGGRKPIMLMQNPNAGYCIAIDIGVTKIKVIITNLCNEIKETYNIPLVTNQFVTNYKQLYTYLDKVISAMDPSPYGIIGIGISVRGVVDLEGVIRNVPILKWKNIDIRSLLIDRYHVPVFVNNDGNLMALAEQENNNQYDNFAVISITDVISTGLVINGKLLQGHHGFANAIGHHTINFTETAQCSCGKYGCWEQYCSNDAVINQMNQLIDKPISRIQEFIAMVKIQDPSAMIVLNQFIKNLAIGIDNIIFVLDCEVIIINSEIVSALPYIISEVLKNTVLPITQTQDIFISQLGEDAAILGASKHCIYNFYTELANHPKYD
ncbi:ROK family transcriptional regulator [Paludicola sp. MB14-C6]|uniref:ROK family transcriptional regulator n=1 Tax=Paludihabitans sp. MB14-C6 TaxID=3070656 RepID=UPI0027DCEE5C|nr:ROK family transcriptional regulator [Paludicola sp. MB14-C6]WMJ23541.1 ROK family transcriptional regulator [Paludicola sp. MB14-C6]